MTIPSIVYIDRQEFEAAEDIYKVIAHEGSNTFGYFLLNNKKYYVGWFSPDIIKVDFKYIEEKDYLLIGVDLKVAVLCTKTGRILFSLGLFSFFKGFNDRDDLTFTIFSELEDIIINKHGLSICQTIGHDLEF